MSTSQQPSLLSLGGGVENLLLSYVSSGDGGLNAILNLRQVCTTTKNWIEKLPTPQAQQILAKCQVEVDLHKVNLHEEDQINGVKLERTYTNPFDVIQKFLEAPPPAHVVNSLKLSGVKFFTARRFSLEEEKVWRRFVLLWWGRLESLEVDTVDNLLRPNSSRVNQLLSAPSLRRLHCVKLEEQKNPLELPQGLFCVEHLSIDKFRLSARWTTQFFEYLAATPKLQSFKLSVLEMKNIKEITNFLVVTKDKVTLELTFTFDWCDIRSPGTGSLRRRHEDFVPKQLPYSFVSAVAASSASIRTRKLNGTQLCHYLDDDEDDYDVEAEPGTKFFKAVEWISELEPYNYNNCNFLLEFPNLKRLGLLKNFASEEDNNRTLFPPGLEELTVEFGFPKNLPPTLTSLTIQSHRSSVTELLESLVNLDRHCPLLKSFNLEWKGDNNFQVSCACCSNGTISNHQDFNPIIPFRNLKRLRFSLDALPTNSHQLPTSSTAQPNVNGACWVLLNGFKLPKLSLLELDLDFNISIPRRNALLPELDRCALISLIRGNIAESLVRVKIDESFVMQDALLLKKTLELMAEENGRKRRNFLGSKMYARSLHAET